MKKLTAMLLAVMLAFTLVACAGGGESRNAGDTFPVTVTDYLGTEMEFEAAPGKDCIPFPKLYGDFVQAGIGR